MRRLLVRRCHHPRVELDEPAQVVTVHDVRDVRLDLAAVGEAMGPVPFRLDFGERERVVDDLGVAARTRIPVPEPHTADIRACLEQPRIEAVATQHVQRGDAAETSAHDDRIDGSRRRSRAVAASAVVHQ